MKKILGKIWKSPRGRVLIFISGAVVVFIVGANLLLDKSKAPVMPSKSANVNINPNQMVKVDAADQQYQDLADKHQQDARENAQKSGKSYMASIFSFSDSKDKNANAGNSSSSGSSSSADNKSMDPKSFYENKEANKPKQSAAAGSGYTGYSGDASSNNNNGSNNYTGYVNPKLQSEYEKQMSESLKDLVKAWGEGYQAQTVEAEQNANGPGNGFGPGQGPVMIKAGSILFAVIDTAVNSDQAGTPVLATIVTGPYKGTKLLGSFKREEDRLVIQFSMMSMPSMSKSIGINAYAIDSRTAQTALASDVDNHYLTRWGGLLGSAFLQGFGTYFSNTTSSSSSTDCPEGSFCIINGDQFQTSVRDGIYSGFGQVGTALADAMGKNFNRPPTVTLDQGTGVGILFMSDVTMTGSANSNVKGVLGVDEPSSNSLPDDRPSYNTSSRNPSNTTNSSYTNTGGSNNYNSASAYSQGQSNQNYNN
ncbi:hypothetical protein L3V83_04130 [Thiotrichales bacterium 19X7-9]|nr:hypothetical protein [Thiotrichales bacterium 19X7-9]